MLLIFDVWNQIYENFIYTDNVPFSGGRKLVGDGLNQTIGSNCKTLADSILYVTIIIMYLPDKIYVVTIQNLIYYLFDIFHIITLIY